MTENPPTATENETLNRTSDDATLWDAVNLFARYPQGAAIVEAERVITEMGSY